MSSSAAAAALLAIGVLVLPAHATARVRAPARAAPHATAVHHPDFNHDGYADMVVSAQGDTVGSATSAGGVWVLYGGAHGANAGSRHQYFTERLIGRGASSMTNAFFGYAYRPGDFNGDGYDDLAVTALTQTVGGQFAAGAVVVLYGSGFGLITGNAQFFTEATSGIDATPKPSEDFGAGLATGDFNHDGFADLAIGANGETAGGAARAGAVFELFGTAHGLSHSAPLLPKKFDETTTGLHGGAKTNDGFGYTLQASDFDGDGIVDLAAAAPFKMVDGADQSGVVDVLRGSAHGLTGAGAQTWSEDTTGVPDASEANDDWGYTLGALDVNRDGRADLVVGAPTESQGATNSVGAATLLIGGPHGLGTAGAQFYILSNTTSGQSPAADDFFGSSFAPLDFDGDGRPDLAIGVEGRHINSYINAGEVVVLHNVGGRLSRSGGFTLDRRPLPGDFLFGSLVRAGDWNGDGHDDLAVSAPTLTVGSHTNAGAMDEFFGRPSGLAGQGQFTANTVGGTAYTDAFMGGADYS